LKGKSIANVTNIRPLCWIEEGGAIVCSKARTLRVAPAKNPKESESALRETQY